MTSYLLRALLNCLNRMIKVYDDVADFFFSLFMQICSILLIVNVGPFDIMIYLKTYQINYLLIGNAFKQCYMYILLH